MLLEATVTSSSLQGGLDTPRGHGERGCGGVEVSPGGGKEIERMAVGASVLAEQGEGVGRERDEAVPAAFGLLDMQQHARTVDLRDTQEDTFGEA